MHDNNQANYYSVVLVECPDPGGIAHGVRTESHWPYTATSTITYHCKPCYTGGGTITCQSNGTWTRKPVCNGRLLPYYIMG